VLTELARRLDAVESELTRVREAADKTGDHAVTAALGDLSRRVAHLRAGFDALDQRP
jgi:hypothetical protein